MDAARYCDELETLYESGRYPMLVVRRPWSHHNPELTGEIARPKALRWYLHRELSRLLDAGAELAIRSERDRLALDDPRVFEASDESDWNLQRKKLFLFPAERMELSLNRLSHYTGTEAEDFQRYVLFTNYHMHTAAFVEMFPDCIRPSRSDVQMPAFHVPGPAHSGVSLVNIGVGPANAKTITDHVAVLRPDLMMMIGHCGGLRNRQEFATLCWRPRFFVVTRCLMMCCRHACPWSPTSHSIDC